ncbi:MAG: hypothetical protein BJ554DRAFT_6237 [Olpidium bornovanus]|uniref:Uncharacterized protein n=1 Tax=Olpidium bornovanus TaxID=278681 RepID=A0A8H7ZY14_9FUNG|nr:MAG: hypothetical protein BJ554DRAFT_6237 [Olpidium bornovanus]
MIADLQPLLVGTACLAHGVLAHGDLEEKHEGKAGAALNQDSTLENQVTHAEPTLMAGAGEAGEPAAPPPAAAAERELADPPEDGVSSLEFHPFDPRVLLAGSWDRTARVYRLSSGAGAEEGEDGFDDGPGTDVGSWGSDAPAPPHRRRPGKRQRDPGPGGTGRSELAASVRHSAPVLDAAFAGPDAACAATAGLDSTVNM